MSGAEYDRGRWGRVQYQRIDPVWEKFCAEVEQRIEAMRLDAYEQPRCPTCDCSAHPPASTRRCRVCGEVRALEAFPRSKNEPLGRQYDCKACRRADSAARNRRRKVEAFRQIVGAA